MRINATRLPLLALAFHLAANVAIADTYVDQVEDFSPPFPSQLVAHFPLDVDGDSTFGGFEADTVRTVIFGRAGANANTGTAASFNGSSSRIQHVFDAKLNPSSFTLAFWAKSNSGAAFSSVVSSRFTNDAPSSSRGYEADYASSEFGGTWMFLSGGSTVPDTWHTIAVYKENSQTWQHIAITYDDATKEKSIYVDGNLMATVNHSIFSNNAGPFNIGGRGDEGPTAWFDGEIDDIGLWNGVLSLQKIRTAMNQGVLATTGDIVSWQGSSGTVNGLEFGTNAFTSIQDAIDAVEDGGTVHIAQGFYAEGAELRTGKNVAIIGAGAQATRIDGKTSHRIFRIEGDYDVALSGLDIYNGRSGGGGGIYQTGGNLSITDCAFTFNWGSFGGGIASHGSGSELTVTGSTFYANFSNSEGGGLWTSTRATIINSTFSQNWANDGFEGAVGGGIFATHDPLGVTLTNCTVTRNRADGGRGGGISTETNSGHIRVSNSIIAGNTAPQQPDVRSFVIDGTNSITSGGGNFVGIDDTLPNGEGLKAFEHDLSFNNTSTTIDDIINTDLTYSGGNTATHSLLPGSPAIDAGIDAVAVDHDGNPLLTDQRGVLFPRSTCLTTDSGAVEADPSVCLAIAQNLLEGGTTYDLIQGIELNTASINFAGAVNDFGVPSAGGEASNFDPEKVEGSIELYKKMISSYTPFWVPGFDAGGVTVTSRGPELVEDVAGGGTGDFDRFPNRYCCASANSGLTNFTEVERAIANPGVSFSVTNHDAVNFGDPQSGGTGGRVPGDEPFPNDTGSDDDDFLITFVANLVVPATGSYHIGFQGDDGGYLRIPGQTFSTLVENGNGYSLIDEGGARILCDRITGGSSTVGIISLTEGVYPIQGGFFERKGGAHFEVFALEPWTDVSALIMRNGAGSQDPSALDLAANQSKLLEAIRELMAPYVYAAKNAQAYGAKARLIHRMDLEMKEQEMDDNARSHLVMALEAFENCARDPQLDYLLRDPVPPGFLDGDNPPFNAFKEARRLLFSAYGRALASLARVDLNQLQREYHSLYDVEVYRGSPTASPAALDAVADSADAAASLLQMRLLVLGAISGLEEFPQGDFAIASSAVPQLRQLASAIRRGETVFIHDADRPSATAGHGYGSYFVPFFYEAGDTGSVFSSFRGLLSKAKVLAGLSSKADATALASIGDYAFNREAVETRLENLMQETNAQLADLCGTIEVIQDGALTLVPDVTGIYSRYPESGQNEQGWSPGQIYQQRLAIHAAQNRYLSAATYLANVRARAADVLDTFLKKKSLNQSFVENILTKNNEQLIGLSKQAGELEADLIQFRAKVQADLKRNQGGGVFGRFATGALGIVAGVASGNPVAAVGALTNFAVGEMNITSEIGATQAIVAEESSVQRQITGLEARKLEISFETELAGIALQLEEEELLVFQQHREILREASRAEIDLESARIDILAQESALGSLTGRVNFVLSELIAELSSLEDSVQNSPDTRIIRDAAIERADRKLIESQEWAFLAARSGQYLAFGNNDQFDFFLEMERRVLAERNSLDLEDYLQQVENQWDLTGISNGLPRAREVRLSLKNDFAQGNYRTENGIVYDFRAGEFSFTENNQETTIIFAGADRRSSESAFGDFLFEHRVPDPAGSQGSEMILIPFSISLQPTTPQLAGANAFGPRNTFYTANDFGVLIDGRGASDSDFGVRVNIRAKGTFSNLSEVDVILRPRGVFSLYHQSPASDRSAIRYWPFDYNAMDREAGITATINGAGGKNPQLHGLSPANDRWELVIRDQDGDNNLFFNQLDEIQDIEIIFALTSFTDSGN